MALHDVIEAQVGTIEHEGRRLRVTCRIAFDGIEYVGHLWFADEASVDAGIVDRGVIPGRTRDDVVRFAESLSLGELRLRHRRAMAERRRFFTLRRATDEVLVKIRYLNKVSVSMRVGLLDSEGAAQELDATVKQLHELVERLRLAAGIESEA